MGCSKMKFDKVDKIFTCFVLIIVTLFCVLNTFSFAIEGETGIKIDGTLINNLAYSNGAFVEIENNYTLYYSLKSGHTYTYYNTLTVPRYLRFTDVVPGVGVSAYNTITVSPNQSYTFTAVNDSYIYLSDVSSSTLGLYSNSLYDITDGFALAISNLYDNVGLSDLWSVFEFSLPYVLIVVLFAFGWWFFSHWIKEISKGREF